MSDHNAAFPTSQALEADFPNFIEECQKLSFQYSSLLERYGNVFTRSQNYLYYGTIRKPQGWIIHLSVVKFQVTSLFANLIPYLIGQNVAFKIPLDIEAVNRILDGKLGYTSVGKIVSIYPDDDQLALSLVKNILPITEHFVGPPIPTDRQLYNIIYTRYGSFNPDGLYNRDIPKKYIYDQSGQLTPDPYYIPFRYPPYLLWPFDELVPPQPPSETKLMNFAYYPVQTLKSDAKGKVFKAVYFRKFYQIRSCLIKEGRHDMFSDLYGRDIRDRLKWQFQLQTSLCDRIPLPRIIEYFQHHENHYLVMEFVKGDSLGEWLEKQTEDGIWKDLSTSIQLRVVRKLLDIINVIRDLHDLGYVHRDINPGNIFVRRNEQIVLIDMELAWSIESRLPSPPFQLGTHGFMSFEQQCVLEPTYKEDVYALGALMIHIFTNLSPNKLTHRIQEELIENIGFFTGNTRIASLIFKCLQNDPNLRPTIQEIMLIIIQYYDELKDGVLRNNKIKPHASDVRKPVIPAISSAIKGLSYQGLLSDQKIWLSRIESTENYIINNSDKIELSAGWHTGVSGPLWVLARAKLLGFDISSCNEVILNGWAYLRYCLDEGIKHLSPGLYFGYAGTAIALSECMNDGLLIRDAQNLNYLKRCFSTKAATLGLSDGIAGQGIALLSCHNWFTADEFSKMIEVYIEPLLDSQLSNGSWRPTVGTKDKPSLKGSSGETNGIVWFLLASLHYNPDPNVEKAVQKALRWLMPKLKSASQKLVLTFIKAYEHFQAKEFKQPVEKWLLGNRAKKCFDDLTLKSGLTGLGETYLEAAHVFQNPLWKEKAEEIAQVFIHTIQIGSEGQGFWIMNLDDQMTADLFNGCSGVLHFLLRVEKEGNLTHPLWPLMPSNRIFNGACQI
jgi:serine/threonine protein kinase